MYKKITNIKYKYPILLIFILLFALILRLIFFSGIGTSDSRSYTEFASDLAKGELSLTSHRALRLAIIFPVSFLYSFLGINEFSSNILPLLFSLGSIVLIYAIGKLLFNEKVGLLSAFLLSIFPMDVIFSTRLMPDLPSAFFVALSVYLFLKSERLHNRISSNVLCFFSGLSVGIAYLMKEISLLIALFFITYAIYNRKIKKRYFLLVLGFALIFFIEFFYFLNLTGIPFFRYEVISLTETDVVVNTNNYGRGSLPFSLLHYPYIIFTDNLLGLFYSFIFISIFYVLLNKRRETYILLFWFVPVLLYISFGSTSFTRYVPIAVAARMLFIITIPGILLLSYFLSQSNLIIKRILMPSIIILLFVTSIGYIYLSEQRFDLDDSRKAHGYLKLLPERDIYTDPRSVKIFDYLSGYKTNDNIKSFNNYEFLNPKNTYALNLSQIEDSYVVINWKLINFFVSSKEGIKFPDDIYDIPKNWILEKKIGKKARDNIEIYYVP